MHGKLLIVLIYTAIGPAVGGALTALSMLAFSAVLIVSHVVGGHGELRDISNMLLYAFPAILIALAYGVPFGYVYGGVQAFVCGLVLAAISDKFGRFGYVRSALAAATVAFFSAFFLVVAFDANAGAVAFVVAAGLPSSLILRLLFRMQFAPIKESA